MKRGNKKRRNKENNKNFSLKEENIYKKARNIEKKVREGDELCSRWGIINIILEGGRRFGLLSIGSALKPSFSFYL